MTIGRLAFVAVVVDGGYLLGVAEENQPGYAPQTNIASFCFERYRDQIDDKARFKTYDAAKAAAKYLNETIFNLDEETALMIVASSMRYGGIERIPSR